MRPAPKMFLQLNDSFALYSCCSCILFAVIRKKRVKQSMMCATVRRLWGFFFLYGNKVLQFNYFNTHRFITTIILLLNLVWKSGYYMLFVITMSQHILVCCLALEFLLTFVATVIISKIPYLWWMECKCLYCRYVELVTDVHHL